APAADPRRAPVHAIVGHAAVQRASGPDRVVAGQRTQPPRLRPVDNARLALHRPLVAGARRRHSGAHDPRGNSRDGSRVTVSHDDTKTLPRRSRRPRRKKQKNLRVLRVLRGEHWRVITMTANRDWRVVVTGAGGFIGHHLVTHLKRRGAW